MSSIQRNGISPLVRPIVTQVVRQVKVFDLVTYADVVDSICRMGSRQDRGLRRRVPTSSLWKRRGSEGGTESIGYRVQPIKAGMWNCNFRMCTVTHPLVSVATPRLRHRLQIHARRPSRLFLRLFRCQRVIISIDVSCCVGYCSCSSCAPRGEE